MILVPNGFYAYVQLQLYSIKLHTVKCVTHFRKLASFSIKIDKSVNSVKETSVEPW